MTFIDQSECKSMKTLNGRRALRCDKHQFRTKMTMSIIVGKLVEG